jgi:hypothetical protein
MPFSVSLRHKRSRSCSSLMHSLSVCHRFLPSLLYERIILAGSVGLYRRTRREAEQKGLQIRCTLTMAAAHQKCLWGLLERLLNQARESRLGGSNKSAQPEVTADPNGRRMYTNAMPNRFRSPQVREINCPTATSKWVNPNGDGAPAGQPAGNYRRWRKKE